MVRHAVADRPAAVESFATAVYSPLTPSPLKSINNIDLSITSLAMESENESWHCPSPDTCLLGSFKECTQLHHQPVPLRDWNVVRERGNVHEKREASRFARLCSRLPTRSVGEGNSWRLLDVRPSWEPVKNPARPASKEEEAAATARRARCTQFTCPLVHDNWESALAKHEDRLAVALQLDIIRSGANVGYDGPRTAMRPVPNHAQEPEHVAFLRERLGLEASWIFFHPVCTPSFVLGTTESGENRQFVYNGRADQPSVRPTLMSASSSGHSE